MTKNLLVPLLLAAVLCPLAMLSGRWAGNALKASDKPSVANSGNKESLTEAERVNVTKLKEKNAAITEGINKVLKDNGIQLYIKSYVLVDDEKKAVNPKNDGPCCCWCGVYLQDCSLCNNFCGPRPPK